MVVAVIFLHIFAMTFVIRINASCVGDSVRITARLFFIPVFRKNTALSQLTDRRTSSPNDVDDKNTGKRSKRVSSSLINIIKRVLSCIVAQRFDICGVIGLDDAAATAYAVGTVGIIYTQVCTFLCYDKLSGSGITPDYDNPHINLAVNGIFSVTLADIIVAVCAVPINTRAKTAIERSEDEYFITE